MSCSIMTIVNCALAACATSSASRAVPSAPRPGVGSSRKSMRGSAARATRDLERAALAVGQARRAHAGACPRAPPRRAPPQRSCAVAVARDSRAGVEAQRAHRRAVARSTFSSAVYSSNRFMIWNERAMPLARDLRAARGR